ncbi:hypothetical protein [Streptomyces carpinensis]|uniref:Uncharacterized protein n=1 Tax=Streptomyces carpinensis TaxID=66369 RepID=A0ABV1WK06_9ACTN|nr:hypothetical protein [Streptomyces carpinensis]
MSQATTTFTADVEALGDLLAVTYEEGLGLADLHPLTAGRYCGIAADLISRNLPRDMHALAQVLALLIDEMHHEDIAPWMFVRHLDAADDVLKRF